MQLVSTGRKGSAPVPLRALRIRTGTCRHAEARALYQKFVPADHTDCNHRYWHSPCHSDLDRFQHRGPRKLYTIYTSCAGHSLDWCEPRYLCPMSSIIKIFTIFRIQYLNKRRTLKRHHVKNLFFMRWDMETADHS